MEQSLYRDIAMRTGGDIYIGVVGPVRTGKSTFIKKFMESMVIPFIDSEYIKSMKYSDEKGFGTYSKVVSSETVEEMIEFTKNKINKASDDILDSKFDINPKFYDKENISCKFCSFQDICYMKDTNLKYLTKVDNLDFLGGEE